MAKCILLSPSLAFILIVSGVCIKDALLHTSDICAFNVDIPLLTHYHHYKKGNIIIVIFALFYDGKKSYFLPQNYHLPTLISIISDVCNKDVLLYTQ